MLITKRKAMKLLASMAIVAQVSLAAATAMSFDSSWESLKQYKCPDWFRDAKLGIWAHWGPQSVPEQGDWYARGMYLEGSRVYKYHVKHYGHPSVFGYKDIVALWKAEKFDPDGLMEKYRKAGAKYFVTMGVHHDNFDLWDSKYHKWNAVKIGPHKDIVGAWAAAARKQGLRFGVSEHLERSYSWFNVNKGEDKNGPKAGVPYDGNDPQYADFYFEPHGDTTSRYPATPSAEFVRNWSDRITDLVDSYQPDLLYTDGGVPFGEVGRSLVAHFYNQNMKWHGGRLEAVYNIKEIKESPLGLCGEYQEGMSVLDLERGINDGIRSDPWQTDTCLGDWFYRKGIQYKTAEMVIHMLADIVSKNGNLLLNFPLKPDGTLDAGAETVLAELGEWMAVNAEAIHGTRPWKKFGEGSNRAAGGQLKEHSLRYGAGDIRFTTKGDILYAIVLGWPEKGRLIVKSLAEKSPGATGGISRVTLLGSPKALAFRQTAEGLEIKFPARKPCDSAFALKIEGAL